MNDKGTSGVIVTENRAQEETMNDEKAARRVALSALHLRKDHLFETIEQSIAVSLSLDPKQLTEAQKAQVFVRAEELVDNWDMAQMEEANLPVVSAALQKLLSEHHAVCELILDEQDEEVARSEKC
jgi:hypothetical protein